MIESFNYRLPDSPYLTSTRYAICIRRQMGFCGFKLSTQPANAADVVRPPYFPDRGG